MGAREVDFMFSYTRPIVSMKDFLDHEAMFLDTSIGGNIVTRVERSENETLESHNLR